LDNLTTLTYNEPRMDELIEKSMLSSGKTLLSYPGQSGI